MSDRRRAPLCVLLALLVGAAVSPAFGGETPAAWPGRVLITNDNGIGDPKIVALARAFSAVAETYVVAPLEDRSGSGSYLSLGARRPAVRVEKRTLGEGIVAYGLDGYPADCVLFGVRGLLRERPPDLVVSGVNGGTNLGAEWFGSGTIGAARFAAALGLPAIAVSGLDDDLAGAVEAVAGWVVRLAASPVVRELPPGSFLTVSLPRTPPAAIRGVRVTRRASPNPEGLPALVAAGGGAEGAETWRLEPPRVPLNRAEGDVAAVADGFIALTVLTVEPTDERTQNGARGTLRDPPAVAGGRVGGCRRSEPLTATSTPS